MMQKFTNLPPKIRLILCGFIGLLILTIIISIPSVVDQAKWRKEQKEATKTTLDKHSGVAINRGQALPQTYGEPPNKPFVVGELNFINYGVLSRVAYMARQALEAYYQHENEINHTNIKMISIGKDIVHDVSSNPAVFSTTIQLDGKGKLIPFRLDCTNKPYKVQLQVDGRYKTIYEIN